LPNFNVEKHKKEEGRNDKKEDRNKKKKKGINDKKEHEEKEEMILKKGT